MKTSTIIIALSAVVLAGCASMYSAVELDKMQQRVAELEEGMGRMGAVHRSKQKRGSKKQTRKAARREKKK